MWPFNIILKAPDGIPHTYHPKSDFSYITFTPDNSNAVPGMIGEVISQTNESDRYRMLCQGLAAVRVADQLMKPTIDPTTTFVIMAVYVTNQFIAERYLLYLKQRGDRHVCERSRLRVQGLTTEV